jgi:hypothetical protein
MVTAEDHCFILIHSQHLGKYLGYVVLSDDLDLFEEDIHEHPIQNDKSLALLDEEADQAIYRER